MIVIVEGETSERWRRLMLLLEPVYERTRTLARRLGSSMVDGDDLFQEAVLRAHDKLGALRDDTRFAAWFHAVLLSVHRSRARRAVLHRLFSLEREMPAGFDVPGADGGAEAEERRRAERTSRALARLPAVQREAVVLFELEGYSIDEIAVMQKVSSSAVKSRLQRGRERLRRHYERLGFATIAPATRVHPAMIGAGSVSALRQGSGHE